MQKRACLAGSTYCKYIGAERSDRQHQGTNGDDTHTEDHLPVFFFCTQHQQKNTGDKKDQRGQHKKHLADPFHILLGSKAYSENIETKPGGIQTPFFHFRGHNRGSLENIFSILADAFPIFNRKQVNIKNTGQQKELLI